MITKVQYIIYTVPVGAYNDCYRTGYVRMIWLCLNTHYDDFPSHLAE